MRKLLQVEDGGGWYASIVWRTQRPCQTGLAALEIREGFHAALSFCYSEVMAEAELSFFTYTCDRCGAMLCERIQIMNLALNYVEDLYCLACLAAEQEMPEPELAEFAKEYVYSRECFKTPWDHFNALPCPKIKHHQCFCQDHSRI